MQGPGLGLRQAMCMSSLGNRRPGQETEAGWWLHLVTLQISGQGTRKQPTSSSVVCEGPSGSFKGREHPPPSRQSSAGRLMRRRLDLS